MSICLRELLAWRYALNTNPFRLGVGSMRPFYVDVAMVDVAHDWSGKKPSLNRFLVAALRDLTALFERLGVM
ncbi:hypothetical protein FHS27_002841 [Rhodopirellula rubra]|uniref:Uncharacterized protein n=1 Tax=Aporhodopirellula rubra TaxID=980271 RepID=A0A7W5DZH1_9BACT|nr:hypothetical protein [Aporhodopirellula rubra]